MFLGIFSSFLPYLLAAGVYLLWFAFSFFQPHSKADENLIDPGSKTISADNPQHQDLSEDKDFHFYDYRKTNSGTIVKPHFPPLQALLNFSREEYFRKHRPLSLVDFCLVRTHSNRPPPAC